MKVNQFTNDIIAAAVEVHRALRPGLLESAYEECLCRELTLPQIPFARQRSLPVEYKGGSTDRRNGCGGKQGNRRRALVWKKNKRNSRRSPRLCGKF